MELLWMKWSGRTLQLQVAESNFYENCHTLGEWCVFVVFTNNDVEQWPIFTMTSFNLWAKNASSGAKQKPRHTVTVSESQRSMLWCYFRSIVLFFHGLFPQRAAASYQWWLECRLHEALGCLSVFLTLCPCSNICNSMVWRWRKAYDSKMMCSIRICGFAVCSSATLCDSN